MLKNIPNKYLLWRGGVVLGLVLVTVLSFSGASGALAASTPE